MDKKKTSSRSEKNTTVKPTSKSSSLRQATANFHECITTTEQSLPLSTSNQAARYARSQRIPSIPMRMDIAQNFFLIWLDSSIDKSNQDCQRFLTTLNHFVNTIKTYTDLNECVEFITASTHENIFMITSGTLGSQCVPFIHHMAQIDSIYILCGNKSKHDQWAKDWQKIKGVFTDIRSLCGVLQQDIHLCDRDSTPIAITNAQNPDQLDPTFMYTTLFKEAVLDIHYDANEIPKLTEICRKLYTDNKKELDIINEFEHKYTAETSIRWYTRECFVYHILNQALRTFDATTMLVMGVFIRHLHLHLQRLHSQQKHLFPEKFQLYRGQALLTNTFHQLQASSGGLFSFNSFLSTSQDRAVSYRFAAAATRKSDHVGVLFQITIDPKCSSTPFALIDKQGQSYQIHKELQLFEVELVLTQNNDPKLAHLTKHIRDKISRSTGWHTLGALFLQTGDFHQAEALYRTLLMNVEEDDFNEIAFLNHQLGRVYSDMGEYSKALEYYEKDLEISKQSLPPTHSDLATSYSNIGGVYSDMGEYSKALEYYEKAHKIYAQSLPPTHPDLATSYSNIGRVYSHMGEYSKALEYYEKAHKIYAQSLPPTHPDLATSYSNIGGVYSHMGEYSKALEYYEKAHKIYAQSLPPTHPDLATSYNNIGRVYSHMGEYLKALEHYEKAHKIYAQSLPPTHPDLATSYGNIGGVYSHMGEYSKALEYYEKAHKIYAQSLPPTHPSLATSYGNIGRVYSHMGEYSKALEYHEKGHKMYEQSLPPTHPSLATSYNNIGGVYSHIGEYSKALEYCEKAEKICVQSLPQTHPAFSSVYSCLGRIYRYLRDYSKALMFFEKTLEMDRNIFSERHPFMGITYANVGDVHRLSGDIKSGLGFLEKARDIQENVTCDPVSIAWTYEYLGGTYLAMKEYTRALEFYGKALEIREKCLRATHPYIADAQHHLAEVYKEMKEYNAAYEHAERAVQIAQEKLPATHPYLLEYRKNATDIEQKL
ncbi:unnamed protein product [Adineta ricciae]|uniref:Uncharacterized protein n=1 Tax=Adineta ricciae TaxID=249248 RepID=A0A814FFR7_ADIRI|nr:unnamed protein product [Adineta ricciae]